MGRAWGNKNNNYLGPELEDCNKVWNTIISELVTDAAVRIVFMPKRDPQFRTKVVVWSPGLDPETGGPRDHIWATKELPLGSVAFSYAQLYELLIVAYRNMDAHLGGQQVAALP